MIGDSNSGDDIYSDCVIFDFEEDSQGNVSIYTFWSSGGDPSDFLDELESVSTVRIGYDEENMLFRVLLFPGEEDYCYYIDYPLFDASEKMDVDSIKYIIEWLNQLISVCCLRILHFIRTRDDQILFTKNIFDFENVDSLKEIGKEFSELLEKLK